jgi:hypothetical protein
VIAAVESLPTAAEKTEAARDEEHRAAVRAMTPGVHKRGEMAPAEPGDPIAGMNAVAGTPGRPDSVEPEAKPVLDPVAPSAARTSAEKRDQQKKKLRSAAKSAPAPKDPPVNMAAIAAVVAAVLIVAVLVVRRIRKRSITSALDVVALAEEAELDAGPAAANESVDERIPVKGFSMDGDSRALEPSLRGTEQNTAAYSLSEVAANETEPESGLHSEDPEGEKKMDLEATDMPVESGEFNASPSIMTGGDAGASQLVQDLAARIENLEARLDEGNEARERLERQVAAQSEELRVQRAAIARTQRALRSLGRSEAEQATEPALRDPAKQADSPV